MAPWSLRAVVPRVQHSAASSASGTAAGKNAPVECDRSEREAGVDAGGLPTVDRPVLDPTQPHCPLLRPLLQPDTRCGPQPLYLVLNSTSAQPVRSWTCCWCSQAAAGHAAREPGNLRYLADGGSSYWRARVRRMLVGHDLTEVTGIQRLRKREFRYG
jgi:hypothetical protein